MPALGADRYLPESSEQGLLAEKLMRRTVIRHAVPLSLDLVSLLAAVLVLTPSSGAAQAPSDSARVDTRMPLGIFVGADRERYLRVLQTLGLVRSYPWSIRSFSPPELDRLRPVSESHPWAAYGGFVSHSRFGARSRPSTAQQEILQADLSARYNSAFPFGMNDGPLWAGRGLTMAAQGGGGVRQGPFSLIVAPTVFWAQNASFPLVPTGFDGNLRFADAQFPRVVDRPQRFGDRAYGRFDIGQTTLRVDYFGVAVGMSTANQWWGPMTEFPYILGNNAAGFPHAFVGSAAPVNIWIGRLHARVMYGGLSQSDYTDITGKEQGRFASGVIALFTPRGIPGLELGAARFYHTAWPDSGVGSRQLRRPFESFFKANLARDPRQGPENQLASVFGRWVLPRSGLEVYGEYGRDDHNGDTRDFLQEPDHTATYGLGLQKAWMTGAGNIVALRGELINYEIGNIARHRDEGGLYTHTETRQGHTQLGQLLGTAVGVSTGGGASIGLERFTPLGSESIGWSRLVVEEVGNIAGPTMRCTTACLDVQQILRASRLRRYDRLELRYGLAVVYELNRNFGRDAMNWNPEVELRWNP